MGWLKAALGVAASAMARDAVMRPRQMGAAARAYCDRVGKPLLLVSEPSLLRRMTGEPVRADATAHHAGPYPVPDKAFGAVFAIGILERQQRPDLTLKEWRRIAAAVFVVVPPWWSPVTWLNPEHRWYINPSLKVASPLWTDRRHVYLLQVSDKGYGAPAWTRTPTSPRHQRRPDTNSLPVPDLRTSSPQSPNPYPSPSDDAPSFPLSETTHLVVVEGDLPDLDELGNLPFGS